MMSCLELSHQQHFIGDGRPDRPTKNSRSCKQCEFYCASAAMLNKHNSNHKKEKVMKRKVKRVIASRGSERLVENIVDENANPEIEWLEREEVESGEELEIVDERGNEDEEVD